MASFLRSVTCGALREQDVGKSVTLSGWVHRVRDLGGLIFIDLRDRFGVVQIVLDSNENSEVYALGQQLRAEFVITIKGVVRLKKEPNPRLETGKIEVVADYLEVLSKAKVPPICVADELTSAHEELRLKYRYLDMRKGKILQNLVQRHKAMMAIRSYLDTQGFVEVVTPVLSRSTPEGSRDYLVPSRVNPGMFFALPQSPQIYKQILMIGGLDRYFQIATCCRDEDMRADRQPEFSQIDMEMSFATQEELFPIVEGLVKDIFEKCSEIAISVPFKRMTYDECMELYGCDKPDLRFGMMLKRLDDLATKSSFSVFHAVLQENGSVKGLVVKGGSDISRKGIEGYTAHIATLGVKGLAWIKLQEGTFSSSISKFIPVEDQKAWIDRLQLCEGDLAFIVAAAAKKTNQALDHLRRKIARDRNLIQDGVCAALWVTDFPLFCYNEQDARIESEHHPFTSPHFEDIPTLESDPLKARSSSYDLVINGYEMASGSQRIHDPELQDRIFSILGMSVEERKEKFGFFIEALDYGTPPHIGLALGFDRICMILAGTDAIRDVIAFPKTLTAACLMTDSPSEVSEEQLRELQITSYAECLKKLP